MIILTISGFLLGCLIGAGVIWTLTVCAPDVRELAEKIQKWVKSY